MKENGDRKRKLETCDRKWDKVIYYYNEEKWELVIKMNKKLKENELGKRTGKV